MVIAHPHITNDCVNAIILPATIPEPCIVEKNPPAIGPNVERPKNPKIYGNVTPTDIANHFNISLCNLSIMFK